MRKTHLLLSSILLSSSLLLVLALAGCAPVRAPGTITPASTPDNAATAYPSSPMASPLASPYPAAPAAGTSTYPYPPANNAAGPYPSAGVSRPYPYPAATQSPDQPASPTSSGGQGAGDTQGSEAWAPQPGDASLQRGQAFIESAQVETQESMPPQFSLKLAGNLPTPCNVLRVDIGQPDAQNNLPVTVYTVVRADQICTQVLAPLNASIPLKGLTKGTYNVLVNGKPAGTIDVP